MQFNLIYPIYLLAVAGLTFICVKSKLLIGLRRYISTKHTDAINAFVSKRGSETNGYNGIYWWLDSIFNCAMCMSVWAGAILLLAWYCKLFVVLYVLSAVPVVTIITSYYEYLCRK